MAAANSEPFGACQLEDLSLQESCIGMVHRPNTWQTRAAEQIRHTPGSLSTMCMYRGAWLHACNLGERHSLQALFLAARRDAARVLIADCL